MLIGVAFFKCSNNLLHLLQHQHIVASKTSDFLHFCVPETHMMVWRGIDGTVAFGLDIFKQAVFSRPVESTHNNPIPQGFVAPMFVWGL